MKLKKILILLSTIFLLSAPSLAAQEPVNTPDAENDLYKNFALSIGFLKGGGSLVGAELEWLFADRFAATIGGGYLGVSAGLNYHFDSTVHSNYIGLFFFDQNVGQPDFEQMSTGVLFGTRGFGFLSAELGVGYTLRRGPKIIEQLGGQNPSIMLVYNIGVYFAF